MEQSGWSKHAAGGRRPDPDVWRRRLGRGHIRPETIVVHASDPGGDKTINVVETLALTGSVQE
jgi:hypothetical protein